MYLIRSTTAKKAHIWLDGDTACRMYSTGNFSRGKSTVVEHLDNRQICKNCQSVNKPQSDE